MSEKTEQDIVKALEIYKEEQWLNIECEKCGTYQEVKVDNQTGENKCWECLEVELRNDLDGLFNTVQLGSEDE
jgi:hypothetical protein